MTHKTSVVAKEKETAIAFVCGNINTILALISPSFKEYWGLFPLTVTA